MRIFFDKIILSTILIFAAALSGMYYIHVHNAVRPLIALPVDAQGVELVKQGPFRISRVIDGDTLVLDNGKTVRLTGVDTPEVDHPSFPVQRFGKEAKQFVTDHFEGLKCYLEVDPKNVVDYYGRTLAYVYVNDVMINSELIRLGYGYSYSRYPHKRLNEFFKLEHQAIQRQYGLWNLSIMDGRITKLVNDYESLSLDGRREYDRLVRELKQKFPREKQ